MEDLFNNTILIVDDTPENIDILVDLLEDFEKQIAIDGADALQTAWVGDPPDLILLDIMMPEMDGYEVCRRLRENDKTKEVPVIFLTAKTEKDDIVKGFEAGGQDYITKPFDARELMERVKTQLELKTQREILKNMNNILEEKVMERTAQLQKAMESLDKANSELQILDVAKTNFLQMISHELRTPLNGICGASYFLNDSLKDDAELGEFVEMLKESVERLERFSTTALLITQLKTNPLINKEEINLRNVIQQSISDLRINAKEKNITITNNFVDESLLIYADKKLILRVFNCIIDNSIKYSEINGSTIVNVSKLNGKIIIEFSDKGQGFSQTALTNLFKTFGMGEAHIDQNYGLSLKVVKLIMEAHGGEIEVENSAFGSACVKLIFNS